MKQLSDGRLVSGSDDRTLKVWDTTSWTCMKTLEGHTGDVYCVSQLFDGRLVSGSLDRTVKVWELEANTNHCSETLGGHNGIVQQLLPLSDGRLLSGSHDGTFKIWDVISGRCIKTTAHHDGIIQCALILSDGCLASGSADKSIKIWKTKSIQQERWERRRAFLLLVRSCQNALQLSMELKVDVYNTTSVSMLKLISNFDVVCLISSFL